MRVSERLSVAPPLHSLPPHVWRLLATRGIRSFSQAYLNVVTPLYLASMGISATSLGLLFTASLLVGAVMLVPVGVYADQHGRKPFLIAFTLLMIIWGGLYATTQFIPVLLVVSAIAGIGRGGGGVGGGQAGPFAPAEQAMLADLVEPSRRRDVFSVNIFIATMMAAAGAALAGLPLLIGHIHWLGLDIDHWLFWFTAFLGVVSLAIFWHLPEPPRTKRTVGKRILSRVSMRIVWRQAVAGSLNAFGMGFVNPLFVLWLYYRFHVSASAIGPVFAISFLVNGFSIFLARALAGRVGSVRAVVMTRVAAAGVTVAIALSPTFLLAAALQVVRTALTMMIAPVRQAFTMNLLPPEERASAFGAVGMTRRIAGGVSPSLAGPLMDSGALELPFFLSGGFLLLSAALYYRYFGGVNETDQESILSTLPGGSPDD